MAGAPHSDLAAAIEGLIRRSDEITAACKGDRGELAALFTTKEVSRSIDICKALVAAVARIPNAAELGENAALVHRLRERAMSANTLLAARTTGNPHLVTAITRAHQCWNEHRDEWDPAAENGDGYFDHKNLARSI